MLTLTNQFRSLSENLCRILEQEGLLVRPYHSSSLPYFQTLTLSEQQQALELLENYCAVCEEARRDRSSILMGREVVNKALQYFGLEVDPKVFDYLEPLCVYEFYSVKQTQFFRTANFFEFNSYTIEDIYCRSWMSLYGRDEDLTGEIFKFANQILSGETKEVIYPALPEHFVIERASLEKLKTQVKFECFAPLIRDGQTVGILSIVRSAGKPISGLVG